MKETPYSGDAVASIVAEAQGHNDFNSIRFWHFRNEIPAHELQLVVYQEEEQKQAIPTEVIEAAKSFIKATAERNEANNQQDHDLAFDIECDQRDDGAIVSEWILEQEKL